MLNNSIDFRKVEGNGWLAMWAYCLWCGYGHSYGDRWAAVFPLGTDESALECPRCGHAHSTTEPFERDCGPTDDTQDY